MRDFVLISSDVLSYKLLMAPLDNSISFSIYDHWAATSTCLETLRSPKTTFSNPLFRN